MKTAINLSTSSDDMQRFSSTANLLDLMEGIDGIELMCFDEDIRGIIPKEKVLGVHMGYFPYWVDFWNGDYEALDREFGSREIWEAHYGGATPEAILTRYRQDLANAHRWGAKYVVFHVSDATIAETFTWQYHHTDEEVIDATCEMLNELLKDENGELLFLVENLWQPGLTFTRPEMTKRLLDGIQYANKGIMLDTGHLLHTNTKLRTQEEGIAYIHSLLDAHGDLCQHIKGIHLNQSLTGPYCENTMRDPPKLADTYEQRTCQMFLHAFSVDKHLPFTAPGIRELVNRIDPAYLTFEFITSNVKEHRAYLDVQLQALQGGGT